LSAWSPVSTSSGPWGVDVRSWSLTTANAGETRTLGMLLGTLISSPLVIALRGDLGTGKTCLTQGIARGLGVPEDEPVTSPSYTLMNRYSGRFELYHFDLYRLSGPEDLFDLGFEEYLHGDGGTIVEWAERAPGVEGKGLSVRLGHAGEDGRQIAFDAVGTAAEDLLDRLVSAREGEGR